MNLQFTYPWILWNRTAPQHKRKLPLSKTLCKVLLKEGCLTRQFLSYSRSAATSSHCFSISNKNQVSAWPKQWVTAPADKVPIHQKREQQEQRKMTCSGFWRFQNKGTNIRLDEESAVDMSISDDSGLDVLARSPWLMLAASWKGSRKSEWNDYYSMSRDQKGETVNTDFYYLKLRNPWVGLLGKGSGEFVLHQGCANKVAREHGCPWDAYFCPSGLTCPNSNLLLPSSPAIYISCNTGTIKSSVGRIWPLPCSSATWPCSSSDSEMQDIWYSYNLHWAACES